MAAARRASVWTADNCQLLAASLKTNNEELLGMVDGLYGATLPVAEPRGKKDAPINIMAPLDTEEPGVRKTLALPGHLDLSRRGGDYAALTHLYTWYKP